MIICGVHGLEPAKDYCVVCVLDIDIPVMQNKCKSVKAGLQNSAREKKKKKGRRQVWVK
jgi:hypothetical protein